jgi:GNAT superfamily N-acetyltransferase
VAGAGQLSFERVTAGDPDATRLLQGYRDELRARLAPSTVEGLDAWNATAFGPPGGAVLVARLDGRPVGCVGLRALGPGVGELKHLFVTLDARGHGVARALLVVVERAAVELGLRTMLLDTAGPLVEAAALYRSAGYREVPAYNDNPHAAAWYRKDLRER